MLAELDVAELTLLFGVKGVINLVFELRFSFGFERIFFGEMRESLKPSFNSWKHSGPTVPLEFFLCRQYFCLLFLLEGDPVNEVLDIGGEIIGERLFAYTSSTFSEAGEIFLLGDKNCGPSEFSKVACSCCCLYCVCLSSNSNFLLASCCALNCSRNSCCCCNSNSPRFLSKPLLISLLFIVDNKLSAMEIFFSSWGLSLIVF
ncbi:hypothetical protein AWRI1631_43650 [Saccharomyces cerevisiae AWRI1631]|uniref:Uncharacterized protein n=1 Tax=Saccharomyces cerevisiae (strain AWRI1631) TaxID=545124 RepID=B5VG43_YEAS6|nr:hypothetical protein AWRI1631_43650 [Saccharomyces cerevisiae AWRI1631]